MLIDPARRWHIARLMPRIGERAIKDLTKAEITVFQPRTSEVVMRLRRRVIRSAQLLPRTIFIGVRDEDHLATARGTQGLAEIVSRPEEEGGPEGNVTGLVLRPARLDPIALQRFADAVAEGEIVAAVGVAVGQSVLVLEGPFASFPAIVEAVLAGDKVKVGVSLFGRPVPLVLDLAKVAAR
ncbi:transcription termination/antitermination protein NusG [Methylorubrum aminovorans]